MKHVTASTLVSILCVGTASAAAGDAVPPAPPISAWLCDDGLGTTLSDSYGAHSGALKGGMGDANWSSTTPFGYASNRALSFDGVDDYVELSVGGIATGRTHVTVSAWFWWDDDGAHKEFAIWGERDECQYNVFALSIERRSSVPNGAAFSSFVRTLPGVCGTGSWSRADSTGAPTSDIWHHVAAVLDSTSGMTLYLDGVAVGLDTNTSFYTGGEGRTTIGDLHTLAYDGYWRGALDEFAVFDYALSPEEVAWLYEHSLVELSLPVAYCTAGTTSSGCTATMSATGAPSVSSTSGFVITCNGVEGQKAGLLFYGVSGPKAAPWAPGSNSFLCVKSPVQRTPSGNSGGTPGACDGSLAIDFLAYLAGHPSALGQPFSSGAVCNAQTWFRDPSAPSTTNLSNALQFITTP